MKYFVCSDLHSHYTPLIESLNKAGYDMNNPEHKLIVCGDVFDRGDETLEVYKYLKSIPKEHRVLVRGNHENLYLELLEKYLPDSYDYSNGTVKTFCHIAKVDPKKMDASFWYRKYSGDHSINVRNILENIWMTIKEKVSKSRITKWLKSKEWVNYYELGRFIFVHSFIPLEYDISFGWRENLRYMPEWRNAFQYEWNDAMWGCPYSDFLNGYFTPEIKNGKTLVCGHWHSFGFREYFGGFKYKNDKDIDFSIFYSKYLIALDTCSVLSKKVNVMVIDNGKCYNENNEELVEDNMLEQFKQKIEFFEKGTIDGYPKIETITRERDE